MTPQERLERELARGLDDLAGSAGPPPIDDILARSRATRQRRAWLPFQRSTFPSGTPGVRLGPVTGRTLSMTPIFRTAAVAGLALALGVALAPVLAPTPGPVSDAPEASSAPAEPEVAWVTGSIANAPSCADAKTSVEKGVGIHHRGYTCGPQVWTVSDPRLSGDGTTIWNDDMYPSAEGGTAVVNTVSVRIENAEGAWACSATPMFTDGPVMIDGQNIPAWLECVGSGGHEGLVAVIAVSDGADDRTIEGVLLRGSLPPTP